MKLEGMSEGVQDVDCMGLVNTVGMAVVMDLGEPSLGHMMDCKLVGKSVVE